MKKRKKPVPIEELIRRLTGVGFAVVIEHLTKGWYVEGSSYSVVARTLRRALEMAVKVSEE